MALNRIFPFFLVALFFINGHLTISCNQSNSTTDHKENNPQHLAHSTPELHSVPSSTNNSDAQLQIPCILAKSITYGLQQAIAEYATRQQDPHLAHTLRHLDITSFFGDMCTPTNRTHNATTKHRHRASGKSRHLHSDAHPHKMDATGNCTSPSIGNVATNLTNATAARQQMAPGEHSFVEMWRLQEARIRTLEERIAQQNNSVDKKRTHQKRHFVKSRKSHEHDAAPSRSEDANGAQRKKRSVQHVIKKKANKGKKSHQRHRKSGYKH